MQVGPFVISDFSFKEPCDLVGVIEDRSGPQASMVPKMVGVPIVERIVCEDPEDKRSPAIKRKFPKTVDTTLERKLNLALFQLANGAYYMLPTLKDQIDGWADVHFPDEGTVNALVGVGNGIRILEGYDVSLKEVVYLLSSGAIRQKFSYGMNNMTLEVLFDTFPDGTVEVHFAWDQKVRPITYSAVLNQDTDVPFSFTARKGGRVYEVSYVTPDSLHEEAFDDYLLRLSVSVVERKKGKESLKEIGVFTLDDAWPKYKREVEQKKIPPTLSKTDVAAVALPVLSHLYEAVIGQWETLTPSEFLEAAVLSRSK
jgi:hypothetical protein